MLSPRGLEMINYMGKVMVIPTNAVWVLEHHYVYIKRILNSTVNPLYNDNVCSRLSLTLK